MSRLRSTIANRLLTVKQETAMLTTFNEVDLKPIKDLRAKFGEDFLRSMESNLDSWGSLSWHQFRL